MSIQCGKDGLKLRIHTYIQPTYIDRQHRHTIRQSCLAADYRYTTNRIVNEIPLVIEKTQEYELKPRGGCLFSPVARIMNEQPLVIKKIQEYELKPRGWCWSSPVAREINVI